MTIRFATAALLALYATPALAQQNYLPTSPYTVLETGKKYNRLQSALFDIGDHKATILIAPGTWDDCGVQVAGDVTFRAEIPGKTIFKGPRMCEDKAALVLRGHSSRVEGFIFADFHSNEGNAAGIRLETGSLIADNNWFRDSDEGILTSNDAAGSISVDRSTFTHLGRCGGYAACAHSIYIGFYAHVSITHNRFEDGRGGHYLKSRASHIEVLDNSFDDSGGKATNYMIDLPAGATGRISGNWFVQGPAKENGGALITVAAEGHENSANGLTIINNVARFAPGAVRHSDFVADWSGDHIDIGTNQIAEGLTRFTRR